MDHQILLKTITIIPILCITFAFNHCANHQTASTSSTNIHFQNALEYIQSPSEFIKKNRIEKLLNKKHTIPDKILKNVKEMLMANQQTLLNLRMSINQQKFDIYNEAALTVNSKLTELEKVQQLETMLRLSAMRYHTIGNHRKEVKQYLTLILMGVRLSSESVSMAYLTGQHLIETGCRSLVKKMRNCSDYSFFERNNLMERILKYKSKILDVPNVLRTQQNMYINTIRETVNSGKKKGYSGSKIFNNIYNSFSGNPFFPEKGNKNNPKYYQARKHLNNINFDVFLRVFKKQSKKWFSRLIKILTDRNNVAKVHNNAIQFLRNDQRSDLDYFNFSKKFKRSYKRYKNNPSSANLEKYSKILSKKLSNILLWVLMPSSVFIKQYRRGQTYLRGFVLKYFLKKFEKKKNRLPDSFQQILIFKQVERKMLIDPCSFRKFKFEKRKGLVKFWSIGTNGKNDKGNKKTDILFLVYENKEK